MQICHARQMETTSCRLGCVSSTENLSVPALRGGQTMAVTTASCTADLPLSGVWIHHRTFEPASSITLHL